MGRRFEKYHTTQQGYLKSVLAKPLRENTGSWFWGPGGEETGQGNVDKI